MARLYLGILLGAMAVGQALSWRTYVSALASHGVGRAANLIAFVLFSLEVVVAAGLLLDLNGTRMRVAVLGVAVTGAWGALALQAFVRRRNVPNCACFGRFMRQELRWWVLLEDVAFVGLAVWHLRGVA